MYAINSDKPYIVQEKDIESFFRNSKKQAKISQKFGLRFSKDCFNFKRDENGLMVASIDVDGKD